jgi:hypothetical protein
VASAYQRPEAKNNQPSKRTISQEKEMSLCLPLPLHRQIKLDRIIAIAVPVSRVEYLNTQASKSCEHVGILEHHALVSASEPCDQVV